MRKISLFSVFLLTACVTINIYFPAAAAEKVADEIIKDIQQSSEPVTDPEVNPPESNLNEWRQIFLVTVDHVLNAVIPPAHAQQANLSIDSAEIRSLRAKMQSRFSSLKPFYDSGALGIGSDGMLVLKNAGSVPLKDRNRVNKLIAAENGDRNQLYKAIANANGHPEWYAQIKSTFAERWRGNAQRGWWYQAPNGSWKQK